MKYCYRLNRVPQNPCVEVLTSVPQNSTAFRDNQSNDHVMFNLNYVFKVKD